MRLGLSSAAAPDATLDELLAACGRRGLTGLELRDGDAHGGGAEESTLAGLLILERAARAGIAITGLRAGTESSIDRRAARRAESLGAPLIVEVGDDPRAGVRLVLRLAADGPEVVVGLRGDVATETIEAVVSAGLELAWDADPAAASVGRTAERVLAVAGDRLRHVRVLGGGPETAMHEGRGIGELMGRLALARYSGSVILAPSSPRYRVAWETWLGRRGGSGCGSKSSAPSLVALSGAVPTPGGGA